MGLGLGIVIGDYLIHLQGKFNAFYYIFESVKKKTTNFLTPFLHLFAVDRRMLG